MMTYISFINPPSDTIWKNSYSLFEPYQNSDAQTGLSIFSEPFERLDALAMQIRDSINLNIENRFLFFIFYKPLQSEEVDKVEKYRVATLINQVEKEFSYLSADNNCYFVAVDQLKLDTFNEYEDECKKIALELDENGYLKESYYRDKYSLHHLFVDNDFQTIEKIWEDVPFQETSNQEIAYKTKEEIFKQVDSLLKEKEEAFNAIGQERNFLERIRKEFEQDFSINIQNALYTTNNREKLQKLSPKTSILNILAKYYSAISNRKRKYPIIYYREENKSLNQLYTKLLSLANLFYHDTYKSFDTKNYWLFVEKLVLNSQDEAYSRLYYYLSGQNKNLQVLQEIRSEISLYNQGNQEIKFDNPVKLKNIKELQIPYFYTRANRDTLEENMKENNKIIDDNQHEVDKYIANEYKKFKKDFAMSEKIKITLNQIEMEDKLADLSRDIKRIRMQTQQSRYEANYANVDEEFNRVSRYFDRLSRQSTFINTTLFATVSIVIFFLIGFLTNTEIIPNATYGVVVFFILFLLSGFITLDKYKQDCKDAYEKYYQNIKSFYANTHSELKNRISIAKSIMQSRYINYDYYLLKHTLGTLKLNARKYQFHLDEIFDKQDFIDVQNKSQVIQLEENFSMATVEHYNDIDIQKGVINNKTYALFTFNENTDSTVNISGKEITINNSGFINSMEIKAIKTVL